MRNPITALARTLGRHVVRGAIEESKRTIQPEPKETTPMLGINKNTTAAGWLLIIWQIAQIVVPLFLPAAQVSAETNVAVSGLIAGSGLVGAKDKGVTGAGTVGRPEHDGPVCLMARAL